MKSRIEIQKAHDVLAGILAGEVPAKLEDADHDSVVRCMSTLCWVLDHEHIGGSDGFAKALDDIMEQLLAMGINLEPKTPMDPAPVTAEPPEPQHIWTPRQVAQMSMNFGWLLGRLDLIHDALCPGSRTGTWQERIEQVVEAAERIAALPDPNRDRTTK